MVTDKHLEERRVLRRGTAVAALLAVGTTVFGGGDAVVGSRPTGTAFTYQGRLTDADSPAQGQFNFVFRLFDHLGNQIGGDVAISAHPVVNGLFQVELDFGSGAFTGDPRELEIQVNGVVLSPRQRLTAVPYAMYALNAATAASPWGVNGTHIHSTNSGNVGIGTANPGAPLHVSGSTQIMERLSTSHTAGAWLEVQNTSTGGKRWAVVSTGSANGEGAGKLLLRAVTDGRTVMTLQGDGRVGVGVTNPGARLHVGGTPGTDGIMFPDGTLQTTAASGSGVFQLPVNATHHGMDQSALAITETGTGHAGFFYINNPSTTWAALFAASNGLFPALHAVHTGGASVVQFENTLTQNTVPTLVAISNGIGAAIQGTTRPGTHGSGVLGHAEGNGNGLEGSVNGSGNAVQGKVTNNLGRAAYFQSTSAGNTKGAVLIESNGTIASKALRVDSLGVGDAGYFEVKNSSSDGEAVEARTNGTGNAVGALQTGPLGRAGYFIQDHPFNTSPAVEVRAGGSGRGLHVEIENSGNNQAVVFAKNEGNGPVVDAETQGLGPAAALRIQNPASTNNALLVTTVGTGRAALFQANNPATTLPAVQISTQGSGPALDVSGTVDVHGNAEVDGNVFMGYEYLTASAIDENYAEVSCSAGKRVIGGGCQCGTPNTLALSAPLTSTTWNCRCNGSDSTFAYVICARIR